MAKAKEAFAIFDYGFSQLRALEFFVFRKMEMPETQNPPAIDMPLVK